MREKRKIKNSLSNKIFFGKARKTPSSFSQKSVLYNKTSIPGFRTSSERIEHSRGIVVGFVYLKYFLLVLFLLIAGSLIVKYIQLSRASAFTQSSFTTLVVAKTPYIVRVDSLTKTIAVVKLQPPKQNDLLTSRMGASYVLGVPLDSIVTYKNGIDFPDFKNDFFSFSNMLRSFNPAIISYKNMNELDSAKLYYAANFSGMTLTILDGKNQTQSTDNNPDSYNTKLYDLLHDTQITNEKVSVEVINSSNVSGVGSKITQMLKNGGYNVIAVRSSDERSQSQLIYRIKPNYSVNKLIGLFPIEKVKRNENGLSDITIIITSSYIQHYLPFLLKEESSL